MALTVGANAATILDSTADNINQANLSSASGQTFTATGLGGDTRLSTIFLSGPQADGAAATFGLEISLNTAAHGTWSPGGGVVAEVAAQDTFGGATFDFSAFNYILTEGSVYSIRFTDGSGNDFGARVGLSNGAAGGTGGSAPGAFADGTLFSGGATVFSDGFDTAISVTTTAVPEPSSTALLGLGGLALILRRRK